MSIKSFILSWLRRWFPKKTLGQRGEAAAVRFLRRRGYKIIARGEQIKRQGELDIVALKGKTIVFVEVKTRVSADPSHPAEAVDAAKQQKLSRLAVSFLKHHRLLEHPARFDVIAIVWPQEKWFPQIEHIQNAFEATGKWGFYS